MCMDVSIFNNNTWTRFMFYDDNTFFYSNLKDDHKFYIKKDNIERKISDVRPKNLVGNKKKIYYTDNIEGRIYEIDYDGGKEKIIYEPYPYKVEHVKNGVEKITWYPSYEGQEEHSFILDFYDAVANTAIDQLSIWDNYLIFRQHETLIIFNLNNNTSKDIFCYANANTVPYNIILYEDKIYYINDIDYRIYCIDCDQLLLSKPRMYLIVDKEAIGFNLYNDNIFFCDWAGSLYKYSLENKKLSKLINSNVNSILVALGKVFYINDSDSQRLHVYDIKTGQIVVLSPKFIRNMNYCKDSLYFYDNNDVLYKYDGVEVSVCD